MRVLVRIVVCVGLVVAGVVRIAEAQKPILKGGVEHSEVRNPDGSEAYLTDGTCMATCGAAREWLKTNYSQAERQRTSTCLSRLDSAHGHEETMVDLQKQADAAAAARDYQRRDDLIKQAHDESVLRSNDLHAFGDCLKAQHQSGTAKPDDQPSAKHEPEQPSQPGTDSGADQGSQSPEPGGSGGTGPQQPPSGSSGPGGRQPAPSSPPRSGPPSSPGSPPSAPPSTPSPSPPPSTAPGTPGPPATVPGTDPSGSPDGLATLFKLFGETLNRMAPHYDMTRPHEGARVIRDILIDMGLGYAAKGLGSAIGEWVQARRALATGAVDAAAQAAEAGGVSPNRGWLNGSATASASGPGSYGAGAGGPVVPNNPGPLVEIPPVLRQSFRPVYVQETGESCGPAVLRMTIATVTGHDVPESVFRKLVNAPGTFPTRPPGQLGTHIDQLAEILNGSGVKAMVAANTSVDQLAQATAAGYPAIVRVGAADAGHFVVVDGVTTGAPGSRYLLIRDPGNYSLTDPAARELMLMQGFSNAPIVPEADFLDVFKQFDRAGRPLPGGGRAILTGPR